MKPEIEKRIEQVQQGDVPVGYRKTKFGIFPDDWTVHRIGDCLERVKRPVNVQPNEFYTQIGIRSHGKGLFYKKPVSGKSLGNKSVFWIEPDCFILNIVFAWEQAIGRTTEKEVGMIGSHRFPMYRPVNGIVDVDYLCLYMLTNRGKHLLEAASPGGAGRNKTLGQDRFMKSKIILPPLNEQKRIVEILHVQDDIITLSNRRIEQLQLMKKYYLQNMFPKLGCDYPEIRFPGFTSPWEQRKLGDILKTIPFKPYLKSSEQDGKYEIIQQGNDPIIGYSNGKPCEDFENTVIFGDHTLSLYKPKRPFFVATDGVRILQGIDEMDGNYLFSLLDRNRPQSEGYKRYYSILADREVFFTENQEEQTQIGLCFSHIDNLITLHQRKRDEEIKKKKSLMQLLLTGIVRV